MESKFKNQFPFYEVWYGKFNLDHERAFWFRYTLMNGKTKESALWAVTFGPDQIIAQKKTYPLEKISLISDIQLPSGILSNDRMEGALPRLQWKLTYENLNGSFEHVPPLLKYFHLTKSLVRTPVVTALFSGSLFIDGKEQAVCRSPGMIGHIWGKQQALEWTWAHCNRFEGDEGAVFEGLSARIPFFKKASPPLTSLYLKYNQKECFFNGLWDLFKTSSSFGYCFWNFKAQNRDIALEGHITAVPEKNAVLTYTDTDDSSLYCHNSKLASIVLLIEDRGTGEKRRLYSKSSAALEWVTRGRYQGKKYL